MFCSEGKIKSVLRPRMKLARIGDIWLKKKKAGILWGKRTK